MEDSILTSTKKMLGVDPSVDAFDDEIVTHINSAFSSLSQIGVGDATPVENAEATWSSLPLSNIVLGMTKTLVFLKVKKGFDPPGTSYLIEALNDQIREQEWRLAEQIEYEKTEEVTPA